jgi:hypothetical protein
MAITTSTLSADLVQMANLSCIWEDTRVIKKKNEAVNKILAEIVEITIDRKIERERRK